MNQTQMAIARDEAKQPQVVLPDTHCVPCGSTGWVYSALDLGGEKLCPRCKGTGVSPR